MSKKVSVAIKQEDISLEASLLKALSNKKEYDNFINCIDTKRLITVTANLLKDYKKYYDKYSADIDWEVFYTEFCHNWHKKDMDENDLAYYRETVFPLIRNADTKSIYSSLLDREALKKLEDITDKGMDEKQINLVLKDLAEKKSIYNKEVDDDVFTLGSVDCSVLDASNGIKWFLPSLQAGLGSLMPGQFILVSADSDTGKSAFCISQVAHTFQQLQKTQQFDRPILYCTSEDTKEDLVCRFLSNLYKDRVAGGFEEIVVKYDKIKEHFFKTYNDNIFKAIQIRGPRDLIKIEQKIAKFNPKLIIIDMLDKLSNSDNIQDLTKLYQEIRAIANSGYPIIGTSQSGNTAYKDNETHEYKHRKWLSDKDVSGSKSGKQGAAYCMIMIGKDDDMPNIRYVSTTKKKRGKHVSTTCQLDDIYSCYKELL